jgi:hypothetical protein
VFELELVFEEATPAFSHAILRPGTGSWLPPRPSVMRMLPYWPDSRYLELELVRVARRAERIPHPSRSRMSKSPPPGGTNRRCT